MSTASRNETELPTGPEHLPIDLQIPILLEQASAVIAHKRIHWGPAFHSHLPTPLQRAINLSTLSDAAVDVIYRNYDLVVKEEPHKPGTMVAAPQFLDTIVPSQGLAAMTSLALEVEHDDKNWGRVAYAVAPKLKSMRSLTIVWFVTASTRTSGILTHPLS